MDSGIPIRGHRYKTIEINGVPVSYFNPDRVTDSSTVSVTYNDAKLGETTDLARVLYFFHTSPCCHPDCTQILIARVHWLHPVKQSKAKDTGGEPVWEFDKNRSANTNVYMCDPNHPWNTHDLFIDARSINAEAISMVPESINETEIAGSAEVLRAQQRKIAMYGPLEKLIVRRKKWVFK